jgi:pyruvate-formate lyase-activating enzyme
MKHSYRFSNPVTPITKKVLESIGFEGFFSKRSKKHMKYQSCNYIEMGSLVINGRINNDKPVIALCCENIDSRPKIAFSDTPEKTLSEYRKMNADVIAESRRNARLSEIGEDAPPHKCSGCADFTLGDWNSNDGIVKYVNLSMYPSPCQCKCIYCHGHESENRRITPDDAFYYDRMFEFLEYADAQGVIHPHTAWQISCGEITIHPYKKRVMDLVKNRRATFYSNCFIYDEDIANNLSANPNSAINLSIDSGTRETWAKVKGVDNFDKVIENVYKYAKACSRPEQITLKYIILPGINDEWDDFVGVVEIMKELHIPAISVSRDVSIKYDSTPDPENKLISAAAFFYILLKSHSLNCYMEPFTPDERQQIVGLARHLIDTGVV